MVLNDRKLRILSAIIDDYVLTALPVGSRTITRRYDMGVSPATIRNEMSDLEELGYLSQPHVSAGRVPSAKAYRRYVDMLLANGLTGGDDSVRAYFRQNVSQLEDVAESAAQVLSELTHYTSVVMMPGQMTLRIATLQLVPLSHGSALLVIVTDSGIVRDTVIHVSPLLDADGLYAISRMLTECLAGKTLKQVNDMLASYAHSSMADEHVLAGVMELANKMERQAAVDSVSVGGPHNILNYPEYADVEKARAFLSVMENKDKLLMLLKGGRDDITVRIGDEIGLPEMNDCSLITVPYLIGKVHRGTVAVIGPTRMPYENVLRILMTVAQAMTEIFSPEEEA